MGRFCQDYRILLFFPGQRGLLFPRRAIVCETGRVSRVYVVYGDEPLLLGLLEACRWGPQVQLGTSPGLEFGYAGPAEIEYQFVRDTHCFPA